MLHCWMEGTSSEEINYIPHVNQRQKWLNCHLQGFHSKPAWVGHTERAKSHGWQMWCARHWGCVRPPSVLVRSI